MTQSSAAKSSALMVPWYTQAQAFWKETIHLHLTIWHMAPRYTQVLIFFPDLQYLDRQGVILARCWHLLIGLIEC